MPRGFTLLDPTLSTLEVGSLEWFTAQRQIIETRPLIRAVYNNWYRRLLDDAASVSEARGSILEIGSGAEFVKTIAPEVITSDIQAGLADMIVDGRSLPFADQSLRAIFLTHVFHHIPDIELFLTEAMRVLVPGGVVAIIEVAHTPLARFFFRNFHPEGYDDSVMAWQLNETDPHGGANQALSWVVFKRDKERLKSRFPAFTVEKIEHLPWLGYLVSGGVTGRNLLPRQLQRLLARVDSSIGLTNNLCSLHWHVRLRKSARSMLSEHTSV